MRLLRIMIGVALVVASFFYLLIFPVMIAVNSSTIDVFSIAFATFLFLQLWMLIAEYAFTSASAFYGWRRRSLFTFLYSHPPNWARLPRLSFVAVMFVSYFFTIYAFGIAYLFLSHRDLTAFVPGALSFVDAMYFSVITAATVGYGDIHPATETAKVLVMAEVIISLMYVVFLFSAVSSYLQRSSADMGRTTDAEMSNSKDATSSH